MSYTARTLIREVILDRKYIKDSSEIKYNNTIRYIIVIILISFIFISCDKSKEEIKIEIIKNNKNND
jgi:hypothetical protein